MTVTTGTTYGAEFGSNVQFDGIRSYVDGDDTITSHEKNAMADALFVAFRAEVDALLPDDVSWQPHTSEFVHPVDSDIPDADEMNDLFGRAWAAVEERYQQIEAEVLGTLPVTADDLEREIRAIGDPIRRARVAGLLVDAGTRHMVGRLRAEAVHEATRDRSREDVAELLGTGVPAIGKLIYEHNQRNEGTRTWTVRRSGSLAGLAITGPNLVAAVEAGFDRIARAHEVGNAAGYIVERVWLEPYGDTGAFLWIEARGAVLAHKKEPGEIQQTQVQIINLAPGDLPGRVDIPLNH